MLAKLASYAVVFEQCNLRFSPKATFDKLTSKFHIHNKKSVSGMVTDNGSHAIAKIPVFTLPTFQGDTVNGDSYLESIEFAFKSAAMADFLFDAGYCYNHPTWSSAFASRLRELLKSSTILNFITDEQGTEENCAIIFTAIEDHLTTGDVMMARAFANWLALFKLKCDNRDDFLTLYSQSK